MSQDEIAEYMNAGVNEGNDVADNKGKTVKSGRRVSIPIINGSMNGHIERKWKEIEQREDDKEKPKKTIKS